MPSAPRALRPTRKSRLHGFLSRSFGASPEFWTPIHWARAIGIVLGIVATIVVLAWVLLTR